MSHLKGRLEDRILLAEYFKVVGGRYLATSGSPDEDPELHGFKTSLP